MNTHEVYKGTEEADVSTSNRGSQIKHAVHFLLPLHVKSLIKYLQIFLFMYFCGNKYSMT
jgi:hypothetical protein